MVRTLGSALDLEHVGIFESEPVFKAPSSVRQVDSFRERLPALEKQFEELPFRAEMPSYLPPGMKVRHRIIGTIAIGPKANSAGSKPGDMNLQRSALILFSSDPEDPSGWTPGGMALEIARHGGGFFRLKVAQGSAHRVSIRGKEAIGIVGSWMREGNIVRWIDQGPHAENRLLWENGEFVYSLAGNFTLEELIHVASSLSSV